MPRNYEEFIKEVNEFDWDEIDYDYIEDYKVDGTEWDDTEDIEEY